MKKIILFAVLGMFASLPATAAISNPHGPDGGHHGRHIGGLFLGWTNPPQDSSDFTWGLEYEYKPGDRWGLGIIAESTNNAHHGDGVEVGILAAHYHFNSLRVSLGLGREWVRDHGHQDLK